MTYYNYTSFLDPISTSYGRGQFGEAQDNRSFGAGMILDNILTYNKKINLHGFEAMAGHPIRFGLVAKLSVCISLCQ